MNKKKKKILRRILIAVAIIVILPGLFFGGFYLKFSHELKGIKVIETREITKDIFAVKDDYVNMFLVKDSNQYIAIDAGNDVDAISKELNKLNINPENVSIVLLTHSDPDHTAALKLFKNAKVYMAEEEVHMLNGDKHKFLWFKNDIGTEYTALKDSQVFIAGKTKIAGILTPGHSSGSMCYLINDKYLFTGDATGLKDGNISKPNEFFSMDITTATASISKLTKLPDAEFIFTAHYGFTSDYKKAVKDWKNGR